MPLEALGRNACKRGPALPNRESPYQRALSPRIQEVTYDRGTKSSAACASSMVRVEIAVPSALDVLA